MREIKIPKETRIELERETVILETGDLLRIIKEDRYREMLLASIQNYIIDQIKDESENDVGANLILNIELAISQLEIEGTINSDQRKLLYKGIDSMNLS